MTTRAMGPGAGFDWLKQAVNLGRNNPKAIFGGAALLLLAMFVLVGVASIAMVLLAMAAKPEGAISTVFSLVLAAAMMALMASLMVGYLRLLDAVENGRPARAVDVFSVFGDKATALRAIGFMLTLMLVQNLLVFGLVSVLAPEFGSWYLQNLQASMSGVPQAPPTSLPSGFGTVMVTMWLIGMFCYGVQSIGFGQIALRKGTLGSALADGVSGAAKNLLPLLVLFLVVVAAAIVVAVAFVLLALLVGVVAKLVGTWLLVLIGIPLYIALVVTMMVVMFGVMYYLWRDVCGDGQSPALPTHDQIEL
ncbi:MAG TPA: hypothetical protein VN205_02770 [Thermomonas sp.]|nr:hypothetical protein [Thermomonas sp.]